MTLHQNKFESPLAENAFCCFLFKIGPVVREDFQSSSMCLFPYKLPLQKSVALLLNKVKTFLHKNILSQVQLKLGQWFWRRFVKFFNVFSLFCYYLLFESGVVLPLHTFNSLYPRIQRCFVQSLIEIGHVLLEKKMKMLKDLKRQQRRRRRWTTMDDRRILIRKAHFSL